MNDSLPGAPLPGELRAVTCSRCGRALTDPESRMLRQGRECRTAEFAGRRFDAEQDALPGL